MCVCIVNALQWKLFTDVIIAKRPKCCQFSLGHNMCMVYGNSWRKTRSSAPLYFAVFLRIEALVWSFPTMEVQGSLRMLLDTLLENETLNSCNGEEKSGAVVVRVRFSPRHSVSNVGSTYANDGLNIGYTRKSPAQLTRDKERARTISEKRVNRSQVRGNDYADVPGVEKERCNTESQFWDTGLSGLVSPVMPATKSRLTLSCCRSAPVHHCRSRNICPGSLRRLLSRPCDPPPLPSPLPALARAVVVPSPDGSTTLDINGHRVHSKCQVLDSGKPGCTNHSCMYGGGLAAIINDFIYDCRQCTSLASSSMCTICLVNGGTCEPDQNDWVLITWTYLSWTADILLIYQRPTFHSWIPEWRTIFFILYLFSSSLICDPVYVVICTM